MQHAEIRRATPMHPMHAPELLRLRDEVETLREENRQLRAEISSNPSQARIARYQELLGLTPGPIKLLLALMEGRVRSQETLASVVAFRAHEIPDPHIVCIYVFRLRKALSPLGVKIKNQRGVGYHIDAASRGQLLELAGEQERIAQG